MIMPIQILLYQLRQVVNAISNAPSSTPVDTTHDHGDYMYGVEWSASELDASVYNMWVYLASQRQKLTGGPPQCG